MHTTGKHSQDDESRTENEQETTAIEVLDGDAFQIGQMSQRAKDGKARDDKKNRVGNGNYARVDKGWLVALAMRRAIGRHDAKGDANGK